VPPSHQNSPINTCIDTDEYIYSIATGTIACEDRTMERKPQQQTLSILISDALREFLERSRKVISNRRGESVSTSDVAKMLLESAEDDRLISGSRSRNFSGRLRNPCGKFAASGSTSKTSRGPSGSSSRSISKSRAKK
jgi:hypothetical protein